MAPVFEPPPHLAFQLPDAYAARAARRAVAQLLASSGTAEWHSDAVLVVSELVANALAASGSCSIAAWFLASESALRVEVMDSSSDLPIVQAQPSARIGGHGMRIVQELTTRWGVETHIGGKTVWFEIEG